MIREWLLYATVIGACCAALAWAIDSWLRATGRARRWLWIAAMLACVVVPALVAVRPRVTMGTAPAWNPVVNEVRRLPAVEVTVPQRWIGGPLWAGASALLLLCIVGGLFQLRRERRCASHETWEATRVAVTDRVGPGAGPFGEPRIFVPGWMRALPGEQVALLLHHEREHVAAGDARLLLGGALLLCVAPWNIALWWCFARLRTAIECDCDARVLRGNSGVGVGEYARLLLDLARPHPRRTPLPALLPLAGSIHQLRTRIESMTASYRLTATRTTTTVFVALVALVAACETRRPDPVAPVADYVVRDGQAAPARIPESRRDSVRESLVRSIEGSELNVGGDPSQPVLVVKDAAGAVVYSGRLDAPMNATLGKVAPEVIAAVEVFKNGAVLPPGARGGMIMIQLKAGATWPGAGAESVAGVRYKAPDPSTGRDEERPARRSAAPGRVRGSALPSRAPDSMPPLATGKGTLRRLQAPAQIRFAPGDSTSPAAQPTVELLDASGREVWSGQASFAGTDAEGRAVGPFLIRPTDIGSVEVRKDVMPAGAITIRLKPGVTLSKR